MLCAGQYTRCIEIGAEAVASVLAKGEVADALGVGKAALGRAVVADAQGRAAWRIGQLSRTDGDAAVEGAIEHQPEVGADGHQATVQALAVAFAEHADVSQRVGDAGGLPPARIDPQVLVERLRVAPLFRRGGNVVDLAVVAQQAGGPRDAALVAVAAPGRIDLGAEALDHRAGRADLQLAPRCRLLGHRSRHSTAVAVERQDRVVQRQVDGDGGTAQDAVLLIGRVLQLVRGHPEGLQVLAVIHISPGAGHAGDTALAQVDARAGGVAGVTGIEHDEPARHLQRAGVGNRLAAGLNHAPVREVALAVRHRGRIRRVGDHLGHAASGEIHCARLQRTGR